MYFLYHILYKNIPCLSYKNIKYKKDKKCFFVYYNILFILLYEKLGGP